MTTAPLPAWTEAMMAEAWGIAKQELRAEKASAPHRRELEHCKADCTYFAGRYVRIYDAAAKRWIPFHLWDAQQSTLATIVEHPLTVILKARQLGLTWLVLTHALWLMTFHPAATVLLFSKRDDEATHLLDFRLKGMADRLPAWMKPSITRGSAHEWHLTNGSVAFAFPTTGGRSYTATLAIVDEADFVPDLGALLNAVKPTIDAGGKMVLLSTADKATPNSEYKAIYRGAVANENNWQAVFLPWSMHPGRDDVWYEDKRRDVLARTGYLDDLHQEYPETDVEALAFRSALKRIPPAWLQQCYLARKPLAQAQLMTAGAPAIPCDVYEPPQAGHQYVIGADPAEGNPSSDDSALQVLDKATGEQVAELAGKFEPAVFAGHIDALGQWYNRAELMVERNNHGHAVLLWLRDNSKLPRLRGHDRGEGWLSSSKGKTLLYDGAADTFRDTETVLHSFQAFMQLSSIEGATLRAPEGDHDDRADAYALAIAGMKVRRETWAPRSFQG